MTKTKVTDNTTFHGSHDDNSSRIISNGRLERAPRKQIQQPIMALTIPLTISGVKGVAIFH
jgi:hypothetical protein